MLSTKLLYYHHLYTIYQLIHQVYIAELRQLLEYEAVSLVIKKHRSRWFQHMKCNYDADWVKHCVYLR